MDFFKKNLQLVCILHYRTGPSRSWSYGSWIYNYLCNSYISSLTLWVRIPFRRGVLDTTLCDKVWQWLPVGLWFSPRTSVSSTNKTNRHYIIDIVLKVALNTITLTQVLFLFFFFFDLVLTKIILLYSQTILNLYSFNGVNYIPPLPDNLRSTIIHR
jgi:heme/copper-type cytochrome/quinol oxidase subunit 4